MSIMQQFTKTLNVAHAALVSFGMTPDEADAALDQYDCAAWFDDQYIQTASPSGWDLADHLWEKHTSPELFSGARNVESFPMMPQTA